MELEMSYNSWGRGSYTNWFIYSACKAAIKQGLNWSFLEIFFYNLIKWLTMTLAVILIRLHQLSWGHHMTIFNLVL